MKDEGWEFDCPVFEFDTKGVGHAVYCAIGPERTYSLVAFGHDLPAEDRTDRVIATAWDATFTLFDGVPDADDIARLAKNVPLQEAGRISSQELSLSRANKSVRLFEYVVETLSKGGQPDPAELAAVGYLMRTTAVYGSGKFGAAAFADISDRPELSVPFQAEMLTVWLIRTFTIDLVEHLARCRGGGQAVPLDRDLRRSLGVGNSTGLGMAPFLVRHPLLLNNWIMVREEALARVRALPKAGAIQVSEFLDALEHAQLNADQWTSSHEIQIARLEDLRTGLRGLSAHVSREWQMDHLYPWEALWQWGQSHLPDDAQEALLAMMLEPHGALIDGLAASLGADETEGFAIDGAMSASALEALLDANYAWAFGSDYTVRNQSARFWYVSEDKLEPRSGERYDEPGAERELPLDIGRQALELKAALQTRPAEQPVAYMLLEAPHLRPMVRRVQMTRGKPFAEIRDNLISADMLPIDMLRCKLACFGATRFDPRSDRWVRISLFQNCPYPDEL